MKGLSLSHVVEIADQLFPFEEAEEWDNCGIQIGDIDKPIASVAFSLDPTPQTVRFAADNSCDLLVTHHPLLLEPLKTVRSDHFTGRTILNAASAGVAILSMHTNLDAAPGGLNDYLAAALGLSETQVPLPARSARLGRLSEPATVHQLAAKIASDMSIDSVRVITHDDSEVSRVFVAAGSGMGYLHEARRHRAHVMVTGDVRYHAAREAMELEMPLIDAGHFGLEKCAVSLLRRAFSQEFAKLSYDIDCFECNTEQDPFQPL
ncbi:Nif3-like dinuclear metal center hexameric protein [Thermodesulfobacteriota bacterium]